MTGDSDNPAALDTATQTFVQPDEYRRLMISNRHLVRRDDGANGLRGLWDATVGVWYVIDEDTLYANASQLAGAV
jgi:hypothetical protein